MRETTRREFLGMVGAAAMLPLIDLDAVLLRAQSMTPRFRIRTITAGISLTSLGDPRRIESAIALLDRAKKVFAEDGFEVQTVRLALPPLLAHVDDRRRDRAMADLQRLDELGAARDVRIGIGPVLATDSPAPQLPAWIAELIRSTKVLNLTVAVAIPEQGALPRAATVAADAMIAISRATPDGIGNFRFAAMASMPPGSPFFPVGYHRGPDSIAIGVESASLVEEAFSKPGNHADASIRLQRLMDEALLPVERTAAAFARREGRVYLGIDPSPAPLKERSIGAAIEALTKVPFGSASTLDACASITAALKSLRVRTCGYAGLMLPVLEDSVLAQRATEGRYGIQELLLYSSVCGTGLDVVPIPGDTPAEVVTRIILDVATLSVRLRKPLSARLFLVPGKRAGEMARFNDPFLTDSAVLPAQ